MLRIQPHPEVASVGPAGEGLAPMSSVLSEVPQRRCALHAQRPKQGNRVCIWSWRGSRTRGGRAGRGVEHHEIADRGRCLGGNRGHRKRINVWTLGPQESMSHPGTQDVSCPMLSSIGDKQGMTDRSRKVTMETEGSMRGVAGLGVWRGCLQPCERPWPQGAAYPPRKDAADFHLMLPAMSF